MTETIDVIDLHKPQDLVTLAEVFAPIEGDTIPYVDPADAYFDDEAYWNAFAEYMEEKRRKVRKERRRYLLQVLRDERDEDSQASEDSDTELSSDSSGAKISADHRRERGATRRRAPQASRRKTLTEERQRVTLLKEIFMLCAVTKNRTFTLKDLADQRAVAGKLLKKNKHQYIKQLKDGGYISQASDEYRQGKYTVTDKTHELAKEWAL